MKNKIYLILLTSVLFIISCTPYMEDNDGHFDKFFFVNHKGANMPVMVEGNIESNKFIIAVHGGPGGNAWAINVDPAFTILEEDFAFVYYDQRGSGGATGDGEYWDYSREQYAEDLNVIIQTIKYHYGNNIKIYLMGHSWGGELTTQYMLTPEYQKNINGWINIGGNQWITDDLQGRYVNMQKNLLATSQIELQEGDNIELWQEINDFCKTLDTMNFDYWNYGLLYDYAWATTWEHMRTEGKIEDDPTDLAFDSNPGLESGNEYFADNDFSGWPFSENPGQVNSDVTLQSVYNRTNQLPYFDRITKPTLIIYGRYDFICPSQLGQKLFDNISTPEKDKKFIELDSADHAPWHRIDEFTYHVKAFIDKY